jgi:glutaminase
MNGQHCFPIDRRQVDFQERPLAFVHEAHRRFASTSDGSNSQVYPIPARVPERLFGICVVSTNGRVWGAGDIEHEFAIMSVSKPFLFASRSGRKRPTRNGEPTRPAIEE